MNQNEFIKEIHQLMHKYGVKRSIIMVKNDIYTRVIATGGKDDGECEYASLVEDCMSNSKLFKEIIEHALMHKLVDLMNDVVGEPKETKKHKKEDRIIS